jgi:exodeoxyribonuclease-3
MSWNVNGIRAVHKKGLFVPFVKKYQPDILCLQETKAEQHQSEVDLPDYDEYWNSAERKGYSGTAIFVKKTLGKVLSVQNDLPEKIIKKYKIRNDGYGDPSKEGRIVAIELKDKYVVSVYTPNAKDDLSRVTLRHKQWDPAFLEFMNELNNVKPVIFCGDLNVAHTPLDLARPKENVGKKGFTDEEREGIEKIIRSGFVDTFRIFTKDGGHYSWWSHFANARARNIGWRIDYIFASKKLEKKTKGPEGTRGIKSAKILPEVIGSDHCPVMIEI